MSERRAASSRRHAARGVRVATRCEPAAASEVDAQRLAATVGKQKHSSQHSAPFASLPLLPALLAFAVLDIFARKFIVLQCL
mmetsp:Transcript_41507/g.133986  ORF Transcript_41507/g.133986 Transcript_41507/m.133986 type:complete len:82 (-) Transcript_41507:93-338(-)